ncbi:MAG: class I SAM-dependent methyltransferase [Longimicrobiales bacterium]
MSGSDYREAFYAAYATTHNVPRKGALTLERLTALRPVWEAHYGALLPSDRSARVLDAGCGDGALLWWLQASGFQAVGVDVSGEQAEIARSLGVRDVMVSPIDVYLERHAGVFDVILMRNVLEHFAKDELLRVLELVRECLAPGGLLVAQVPNAQSPFAGRIRYGDFTHELAFTDRSLNQLLTVCGFASIRCQPVPPVHRGPTGPFRQAWWKAVQFLYRSMLAAEVGGWPSVVTLDIIVAAQRSE